jgi:signal transduction histidine kinase/CheY-like chemotaxis protein
VQAHLDFKAHGEGLVRLLAALVLTACLLAIPLLVACGAPRAWMVPSAALVPSAAASLWLLRQGQRGLAAMVLLVGCDFGVLAFHLSLGPAAHLLLPSVLLVVCTFPLFLGASRQHFLGALAAQTAVLLVVALVPASHALDPSLAVHAERLGLAGIVLSLPLLLTTLRMLRDSFDAETARVDHSRDRWEQLMASAPIDVVVTGPDCRIEASNRPERDGLRVGDALADALGGHDPARVFANLRPDGDAPGSIVLSGCGPARDRSLRVSAQPLLEGRCLVALDDVTHRRRQRAALRNAQEEVALASRSRTRLMGRLAHELRTPLTLVLGHAEVLREDETLSTAEVRRGIDEIHASARHLQTCIDDLLHAARNQDAAVALEPRDVDIGRLCAQAMHAWAAPAAAADIQLRVEVRPGLTSVQLDPGPVRRILWQLLSNALRVSASGSVVLHARRDGGELILEVEDDGIGIPAHLQTRVLMPLGEGIAENAGGLGLGLATARQRARRLGGDLQLSSRAEGGTVATLWLPFETGSGLSSTGPSLTSPQQQLRALVVDDLPLNAEVAAALLEERGLQAIAMTDPEQALERLQQESFAVVLIDCHMPQLSGYDLAAAVAGQPGPNASTPLVALTVDESRDCARRCREAGFFRRLVKPLTSAHVDELLASALDSGAVSARPRQTDHLLEALRREFTDPEFVAHLVETWLSSTAEQLSSLKDAVQDADRVAIEDVAHALRSPALAIGAHHLAALATELEGLAPSASLEETVALVGQLSDEAQSVRGRLRRLGAEAA